MSIKLEVVYTVVKTDRRVIKTKNAIETSFIHLMSTCEFNNITIQNIADHADVNRATVYLHYLDKYDLLDKIIEEHIRNLSKLCEEDNAADLSWADSTIHCIEYLEEHYVFFSTMLTSDGGAYFRKQFLQYNIEQFKKELDSTQGEINNQNEEVVVEFAANAYVGIVEWWIKNEMPYPPKEMAKKVGELLSRII